MREILGSLLESSIAVTIVIVIVLIGRLLLKKSPRVFSYALWFLVLLRIVCPFSVQGVYALLPDGVEKSAGEAMETVVHRPLEFVRLMNVDDKEVSVEDDTTVESGKSEQSDVIVLSEKETEYKGIEISSYLIVFIIWLVGVGVLFAYLLSNLILSRYRLANAIRVEGNVWRTDAVANSLIFGLVRPKIYVNPRISQEELPYILAHESCHIRRKDYLIKPFAFLIFSFQWFNPFIWIAYVLMMKDMEMSCDESVMRQMGGSVRKEYSYLLLNMACKTETIFMQTPAFGGRTVKKRIENVLKYKKPAITTILISVLVFGLCGCSIFSTPDEPEKTNMAYDTGIEKGTYIEKKLGVTFTKDVFGAKDTYNWGIERGVAIDPDGAMYLIADEMEIKGKNAFTGKPLFSKFDGETLKPAEELTWTDDLAEHLDGKYWYKMSNLFGEDGYFYQLYVEYNRPLLAEETQESSNDLEMIDYHLIKADMKANTWEEVVLPEYKGTGTGTNVGRLVDVFADGNLFISDYSGMGGTVERCVYNPKEQKKVMDVNIEATGTTIVGNGEFYIFENRGDWVISVFSEATGEKINEISCEGVFDEDYPAFSYVYQNGTIYILSVKGIYAASTTETEFTCVMDAAKSRVFYLKDTEAYLANMLVDEEKEAFYAFFYKPNISEDEAFICEYTKKEE